METYATGPAADTMGSSENSVHYVGLMGPPTWSRVFNPSSSKRKKERMKKEGPKGWTAIDRPREEIAKVASSVGRGRLVAPRGRGLILV